jgi:LmbE family N-acetylglucosaminyl deacetylase
MAERPVIVYVVAHPDDIAHSLGGTALLLKERYRLHVICASRGERGYVWQGPGPAPPSEEVGARREAEERAACRLLDANVEFLGMIDGEIYAERSAIARVAERLRELRPAAVFGLGPREKPDHAAAYLLALQALHQAGLFWTTELWLPLRHTETRHDQYHAVFVDIGRVLDAKRALIRCHRSQNPDEAHVERVLERNRLLGALAWCDYAEAYTPALAPMARRWKRRAGCVLLDLDQASAPQGTP